MARMGEVEPVGLGSSLKFCRLAEGAMDVYPRFGPTSEWDTGAGQAILEGGGGQLLDLVWAPGEESLERTVDTHIKTLRAKLRAIAPQSDPVRTHRGVGYSIDVG